MINRKLYILCTVLCLEANSWWS